jgi:hypothetical protein
MASFAVKMRPPQLALARSTDGGSGQLERGEQFDPTPMLDRPGVICGREFESRRGPPMLDRPGVICGRVGVQGSRLWGEVRNAAGERRTAHLETANGLSPDG